MSGNFAANQIHQRNFTFPANGRYRVRAYVTLANGQSHMSANYEMVHMMYECTEASIAMWFINCESVNFLYDIDFYDFGYKELTDTKGEIGYYRFFVPEPNGVRFFGDSSMNFSFRIGNIHFQADFKMEYLEYFKPILFYIAKSIAIL